MPVQDRCLTLNLLIEDFANTLALRDITSPAVLMLRCLHTFAGNLIAFFADGFNGVGYTLSFANATPEYVFGLLHDQMSYDLDAILRAYMQRMVVSNISVRPTATSNALASKVEQLEIADRLAYQILRPAIAAGVVPANTTAFTYFQKDYRIRILPYAPVAFVGLPFSAINNPMDYVALAHEIGHFIFHYRNLADRENSFISNLRLTRKSQPDLAEHKWLQEIFADVFGCMIAGPTIAESFRAIAQRWPSNQSHHDDGHHPPPAVRPLVYALALTNLAARPEYAPVRSYADALTTGWNSVLQTLPSPQPAATPAPLDEALQIVNALFEDPQVIAMISAVAAPTVPPYGFQQLWHLPQDWTAPVVAIDPEQLAGWAGQWSAAPQVQSDCGADSSLSNERRQISLTGAALTENQWIKFLESGGWIDQGPAGGVPHK